MVYISPSADKIWNHTTPLTSLPEAVHDAERWIWIVLTRRKEGVTREQFVEHYEKIHPTYSLAMPGLLCYRQTVLSTSAGPFAGLSNKLVQFDALSEYHYVSKQAWLDAQETEAGVQLQADSESFMDMGRMLSYETVRARVL